jgi:Domain of unknown function (DUF1772)
MTGLIAGTPTQRRRWHRAGTGLLRIAQLGQAHAFFGNLYEAVVRIPDRLSGDDDPTAADQRMPSLFSPASPVRYYLPGVPVTVAATLAALLAGWSTPSSRRWLTTSTACTLSAAGVTAHLVAAINVRLFVAGHPLTPPERQALLRTWYRLNAVRLLVLAAAWASAEKARSASR